MNFSQRLKLLREEKSVTQNDIAKIIGVGRATIAGYETKGKQPDYEKLLKLSDYFNVTTDYLLGKTDIKNSYEIKTLAAHHDGDDWTEEELSDIEKFKEYVRTKRES